MPWIRLLKSGRSCTNTFFEGLYTKIFFLYSFHFCLLRRHLYMFFYLFALLNFSCEHCHFELSPLRPPSTRLTILCRLTVFVTFAFVCCFPHCHKCCVPPTPFLFLFFTLFVSFPFSLNFQSFQLTNQRQFYPTRSFTGT